jgi:hypothetical protein
VRLQQRPRIHPRCPQVLDCITEDNERSARALVSADARMSAQMKSFLLRCLDKSPNTRPAAIDLMSDPWLAGVDRNVSAAPRAAAVRAPALLNRALQAGSTRVFTVTRRVLGCAAAGGHPQRGHPNVA